ncbi:response regulator transcription factor [Rubrolithibacter danxiaensis]|uniref:response regulator transcription factor n=1 Tax=Rubrolithibacter danxiaensis TaxID=3390805 RepID=UPI003BF8F4FC
MWYLILLFLLIVYNTTGGLFPDPEIDISIITQNIIAYGSGFLMASYFPYYFYKAFDLQRLRLHAIYGVPLFLITPYIIFFVIEYSLNGNLNLAIKYGIIIPFFYSLVLLWAILRAIRVKFKDNRDSNKFPEVVAVYCAVIPWASMTVFAYFNVSQLVEVIFTNGGFIIITIIFITRSINRARIEYERLMELNNGFIRPFAFEENCKIYQLTCREIEIVRLIRQGCKYKTIGETLFISEKTVNKHVQNIFDKVNVSNKVELLNKLEV